MNLRHSQTGFPRLLESPGFFCKIFSPWKVVNKGLVLESLQILVKGGIF